MERVNNPEKLQERIQERETLDLLFTLDNADPVKEYEILLQKRTAEALEEISDNLGGIYARLTDIYHQMGGEPL